MSERRNRNFATIVYPDSAPEDWETILSLEHVPAFVSPLHDADVNNDGVIKKSHYHVLIMFSALHTYSQAQEIFEKIGGVGCESVRDARAYSRYLCHLDELDKVHYSLSEVRSFGGADYQSVINLATDKYIIVNDILNYCSDNNVYNYADLVDYCRRENAEWFRCLVDSCTYVVKEYLKSKTYYFTLAKKNYEKNLSLANNSESEENDIV